MRRFCIRRGTFILALIATACLFGGVSPSRAQQLDPVPPRDLNLRGNGQLQRLGPAETTEEAGRGK